MSGVEEAYRQRYEAVLKPLASALENYLREIFQAEPRIDRIAARPKSIDRFVAKASAVIGGRPRYSEPLRQIQDQIGARIITFYRSDVERVHAVVMRYFKAIELQDMVPESEWEFGYFGRHFILLIPSDVISASLDKTMVPQFFELQIKTLFQHAWSEANHDLGYKPGLQPLTSDAKRRLAFTSAQAWGADRIFDELFKEREEAASGGASSSPG
jgi:putative GTP pyrophosphokinase